MVAVTLVPREPVFRQTLLRQITAEPEWSGAQCARVVRSSALAVREVPYIDAARACGFGHTRITLRHMVPNVLACIAAAQLVQHMYHGRATLGRREPRDRSRRCRSDAGCAIAYNHNVAFVVDRQIGVVPIFCDVSRHTLMLVG
jgi:hypothetical protein